MGFGYPDNPGGIVYETIDFFVKLSKIKLQNLLNIILVIFVTNLINMIFQVKNIVKPLL